jgi:hypothetical protein
MAAVAPKSLADRPVSRLRAHYGAVRCGAVRCDAVRCYLQFRSWTRSLHAMTSREQLDPSSALDWGQRERECAPPSFSRRLPVDTFRRKIAELPAHGPDCLTVPALPARRGPIGLASRALRVQPKLAAARAGAIRQSLCRTEKRNCGHACTKRPKVLPRALPPYCLSGIYGNCTRYRLFARSSMP